MLLQHKRALNMPMKDINLEVIETYLNKENVKKLLTLGIYDILASNDQRLRYHIEVNISEFKKSLELDFELMLESCDKNAENEEHILKREKTPSFNKAYCHFYKFISNHVNKKEIQEVSQNLIKMFDYFKPTNCK